MTDITNVLSYSFDDYATGEVPYIEIFECYRENEFIELQAVNRADEFAKKSGYKSFKSTYKKFKEKRLAEVKEKQVAEIENDKQRLTSFTGQPGSIACGAWVADDLGVRGVHPITRLPVVACPHPIMPFRRLVNVDSGIVKIDVRFKKPDGAWSSLIVDRSVIASSNKIVSLADRGIGVTSETAKDLVRYFLDCESNSTTDQIKTIPSANRLGYIGEYGFSPYCEDLIFDGDQNYKKVFDAVHPEGDAAVWKEHILKVRENLSARLVIDAAFASVVLAKLNVLPFCVHLWGVESGTGKTVALMCAASVWADPSEGKYIQTWNSTQVGRERYAALLNNLPLIFDELQLDRTKGSSNSGAKLYELAQGIGRTRGAKSGIDTTASWSSCIISSGETPITSLNQGAGALNRALEIECSQTTKLIEDGHGTAEIVKANFGHAGREWIQVLENPDVMEQIRTFYDAFFMTAVEANVTDKQAMAGAVLYAVDSVVKNYIFDDAEGFIYDDQLLQFLKKNDEVDINRRAYQFLLGWIAQNFGKFQDGSGNNPGFEVYGRQNADNVVIIKKVFDKVMNEEGYSPNSLVKWMAARGLIVKDKDGHSTYNCYVNRSCNCLVIKSPVTEISSENSDPETIPEEFLKK